MLHAPIQSIERNATLAPLPFADADAPCTDALSPGTYLRMRREAAGLSLDKVVSGLRPLATIGQRSLLVQHLAELENDEAHVTRPITTALAAIIPLDVNVYDTLVAIRFGVDLVAPQLCKSCACSIHDACVTNGMPCAWSGCDTAICTACEPSMPIGAEARGNAK